MAIRHWKDHFDPTVEMVFIKRLRLGLAGTPAVVPGDPVTPEIMEKLGIQRLKIWWKARVIASKAYAESILRPSPLGAVDQKANVTPTPSGETGEEAGPSPSAAKKPLIHVGGGWFKVVLADGTSKLVHGKDKAEKFSES